MYSVWLLRIMAGTTNYFKMVEFILGISAMMLGIHSVYGDMIFVQTVNDSYTFTLNADLYYKPKDAWRYSVVDGPKRWVPLLESEQWNVEYNPFDYRKFDAVGVYLNIPGQLKIVARFSVEGTTHEYKFNHTFHGSRSNMNKMGNDSFIKRDQFLNLLNNGTMTIRCDVEFIIPYSYFRHDIFEILERIEPDFDLVVGADRIKTNSQFLSLISPVFKNLISNSSDLIAELKIDNFTYDAVKTAIDMSYGHRIHNLTAAAVIDVLYFAEEFELTSIAEKLEESLSYSVFPQNFIAITDFAFKNEKKELQTACVEFFKKNREQITQTREFAELNPLYRAELFRKALNLD
uniref:BTB domain-containing protein n=2 Tax=Panagrellus redivivus TaxID=6233 RepID=A0A7E4USW4_PANRE